MLSAHSTGGLIVSLWADQRGLPLAGTVLNSPWVDMHGPFWLRLGSNVIRQLGGYQPRREIPRSVTPWYGHALHRSFEGEWDYDLDWKPLESWPVYVGWLRAIRRAHARLHRGLSLTGPVLVLTSGRTGRPKAMDEEVWSTDIVLDVNQMRRWATQVGPHVTVVSVEGAIHDVVLSRPEPGLASTTSSTDGSRPTSSNPPLRRSDHDRATPQRLRPGPTAAAPAGAGRAAPRRAARPVPRPAHRRRPAGRRQRHHRHGADHRHPDGRQRRRLRLRNRRVLRRRPGLRGRLDDPLHRLLLLPGVHPRADAGQDADEAQDHRARRSEPQRSSRRSAATSSWVSGCSASSRSSAVSSARS